MMPSTPDWTSACICDSSLTVQGTTVEAVPCAPPPAWPRSGRGRWATTPRSRPPDEARNRTAVVVDVEAGQQGRGPRLPGLHVVVARLLDGEADGGDLRRDLAARGAACASRRTAGSSASAIPGPRTSATTASANASGASVFSGWPRVRLGLDVEAHRRLPRPAPRGRTRRPGWGSAPRPPAPPRRSGRRRGCRAGGGRRRRRLSSSSVSWKIGGPGRARAAPARVAGEVRVQRGSWLTTTTPSARHPGVQLEGGDAEGEGPLERGQRVLGGQAARAAMALQVEGRRGAAAGAGRTGRRARSRTAGPTP